MEEGREFSEYIMLHQLHAQVLREPLAGQTPNTLLDIDMLSVIPKAVRPLSQQLPNESRKLWEGVTNNLLSKNFNEATKIKQVIEQRQRDIAAQRKAKGTE